MRVGPLNTFCLLQKEKLAILTAVCEWERLEYGEGKHRIPETLALCIAKDSSGFICAMEDDRLIGYADLWQLHPHFYELLLKGEAAEEEICAGFIMNSRIEKSGCWYVGSIITEPSMRENRGTKAAQVFFKIYQQLYEILLASPVPARVMGVGSTDFGASLMGKHKFFAVTRSANARDLRPRFEKHLEALTLEPVLN